MTLEKILKVVVKVFKIPRDYIIGRYNSYNITDARFAYYLLAKMFKLGTFKEIANYINRKDHTAAMNGIKQSKNLINTDSDYKVKFYLCLNLLGVK